MQLEEHLESLKSQLNLHFASINLYLGFYKVKEKNTKKLMIIKH